MLACPALTTPPVGSCVEATVDCAQAVTCAQHMMTAAMNAEVKNFDGTNKRHNFTSPIRLGDKILKSECKEVVILNYFCGFS